MKRFVLVALLLSGPALAQDRPTTGIMYNTTDWASIQYDCSIQLSGTLDCAMTQASVRKETSGRTLEEEISKAVASLKTERPMKPEDCASFEQMGDGIRNPPSDPSAKGYKEMKALAPRQKDDLLKMVSTLVDFCKNPTEANARKMTTTTFDRDSRTCKVHTNYFMMKFKRVDGSSTWTANIGPEGQCGIVTVARMEQDSKYKTFWNYTQKRVITNPAGTVFGAMKCSQMDQNEYKYQWQSREIFGQCDYIKFGL